MVSGGLLAAAATFSLISLAAMPAVAVLLLNARHARAAVALSCIGMAIVAAASAAALAVTGGLPAAMDAVLQFNRAYVAAGDTTVAPAAMARYTLALLPMLLLAAGASIGHQRMSVSQRALAIGALTWILSAVFLIVIGRQLFGHYLVVVLPPFAMLATIGALVQWPTRPRDLTFAAALLAAATLVAAPSLYGLSDSEMSSTRAIGRAAAAAGSPARAKTTPEDRILVWGNAAVVYHEAQRRPSTPNLILAPLMTRGYTTEEAIQAEVDRWCSDPPALIVDAGSLSPGVPGMPPLLVGRATLQPDRRIDLLDALRDVAAEHYVLASGLNGYLVYELRAGERPLVGQSCAVP